MVVDITPDLDPFKLSQKKNGLPLLISQMDFCEYPSKSQHSLAFELNHGNCEENKFRYCPFCGKAIAEEKYVPEPEEEPVYLRSMVMGEQ